MFALAAALGGFYLLANIAREYGARIEPKLFKHWGGMPTTQLQRHSNPIIDVVTKASRHRYLAGKLGIPFPGAATEAANPAAADQAYAAGTRWLLEHTRDHGRFRLLFEENMSYGYRRNALGLKPIAITICLLCIIWVFLSQNCIGRRGLDRTALSQLPPGAWLSLGLSILLLAIWIFFFTKHTVKTAAFAYADQLLRACEVLG